MMAGSKKKAQIMLDIILPKGLGLDSGGPNDMEANALYDMWKEAPPGTRAFSVSGDMSRHVNSWKVHGLVEGLSNSLSLTDRGRRLIRDMVTNEPNAFDKTASMPRYSVVKARKKQASSGRRTGSGKKASREARPFNLRKERDRDARKGD